MNEITPSYYNSEQVFLNLLQQGATIDEAKNIVNANNGIIVDAALLQSDKDVKLTSAQELLLDDFIVTKAQNFTANLSQFVAGSLVTDINDDITQKKS